MLSLIFTHSGIRRIQEEGLRTYLFTYAPHYNSLSLSLLSRTFSLPIRTVTSIVSKMIWSEELSASLDQAAKVIVFHRIDLTRTQQLAQVLADKINTLVEQNEKLLDTRLGVASGWNDRADGGKAGDKRGEQTQERRGRVERTRGGARGKKSSYALRLYQNVAHGASIVKKSLEVRLATFILRGSAHLHSSGDSGASAPIEV